MRTFTCDIKSAALTVLCVAAVGLSGCSTSFKEHIVELRNAQGDAALENQNVVEAEKEYGLALQLSPNNEHARAGYARVLYLHAKADFAASKLDDAYREVQKALQYAPKDAATLDLAAAIDQAKIRRDVVVQNFPAFKTMSDSISESLKANALALKEIQAQIHAFHTDFDVTHLAKAIALSYDLESEQHRMTQRLTAYRNQIAAGAPAQTTTTTQAEAPGLLPIP